jgi:nucleoporin p58/p45
MGQSTQQTVPGARIDLQNVKGTTRFNDLHEDIQREIEAIGKAISQIMANKNEIDAFMPQHEEDVTNQNYSVKLLLEKYEAVQNALNEDVQAVKHLQGLTSEVIEDAKLSFKAVDNLKLPAHYHTPGLWGRTPTPGGSNAGLDNDGQDMMAYFNTQLERLDQRHVKLKERLAEIEEHMPGVEAGLYERLRRISEKGHVSDGARDSLVQALYDTHETILNQAKNVAQTREQLVNLQLGITNVSNGRAQ